MGSIGENHSEFGKSGHGNNIVETKYGLDKSEAINRVVLEHEEILLEPTLRSEFVAKMRKRSREKTVKVADFAKRYGLK